MLRYLQFAVCCLALSACAQSSRSPDNGYWKATSTTARSITGDIVLSPEKLTVQFMPFTIAEIRALSRDEITAAFNLDAAAAASGSLYRLSIPADRKFLHRNTLCGSEETQWMATAVSGKTMQAAFFSGDKMPDFKPEALNNSTDLCGTYTYNR